MSKYDKELAICEAATPRPIHVIEWAGSLSITSATAPYDLSQSDATFFETFGSKRVMELLEAERERDELKEALGDIMVEYEVPVSDYLKGLLK
jgi:hypothetical protein